MYMRWDGFKVSGNIVNLLCFSLFWALVWFGFWRSTWKKVKHHVVLFAKQVFHDVRDKLKEGWWRILHVSTLLSLKLFNHGKGYSELPKWYLATSWNTISSCIYWKSLECDVIFACPGRHFIVGCCLIPIFCRFFCGPPACQKRYPKQYPKQGLQRRSGLAWIFLISGT